MGVARRSGRAGFAGRQRLQQCHVSGLHKPSHSERMPPLVVSSHFSVSLRLCFLFDPVEEAAEKVVSR